MSMNCANNDPDLQIGLVADGAEQMWNLLDEQLNKQTLGVQPMRLVDFWHNVEKLGEAAKVLFGDRSGAQRGRWRMMLLNQSTAAAQILGELSEAGREWVRVGDCQPVHQALTYLANRNRSLGSLPTGVHETTLASATTPSVKLFWLWQSSAWA